jgi:hypothetical protein
MVAGNNFCVSAGAAAKPYRLLLIIDALATDDCQTMESFVG